MQRLVLIILVASSACYCQNVANDSKLPVNLTSMDSSPTPHIDTLTNSNKNITTVSPNSTITTSSPPTTTSSPPTTTPPPPTTSSTSPTTLPTTTSKPTTQAPTSPIPDTNSTTAAPPTKAPTTIAPATTTVPPSSNRRFDGPSFIGGIVLALGLIAIGFMGFKYYKSQTEQNYHTL